jgi:hypothetical protein
MGQGVLRGGLGVWVIVASAALGAVATIVGRVQPGLALGLFVLAGTVAAALTVEPRAGRLIFPVPALSYLIAALASGVAYNRSSDSAELAVGATQWIANGFFVMVLATLLAIALTMVRWFLWRRHGRLPLAADWTGPLTPASGARPPQVGPSGPDGWGEPRSPGGPQGFGGPQAFSAPRDFERRAPGWPADPGRNPYQRPGPGSYNFSSGA